MNIRNSTAGNASEEHILSKGFEIYDTIEGDDMGQSSWSIPQFRKGDITITGGYWNWVIRIGTKEVFSGWWNSNDEFDETLKLVENYESN